MASADDHKEQLRRGMARLVRAERASSTSLDRYSNRSASSLTLNDLAEVVAAVIEDEKRDLVAHMNRLFKLATIKSAAGDRDEGVRATNLHRRLCAVESAIRALQQKGSSR
jgi:hypothetical protein